MVKTQVHSIGNRRVSNVLVVLLLLNTIITISFSLIALRNKDDSKTAIKVS